MERDQEGISLKGGSSFQPLRQGRSSISYLHQTGERLESDRGVSDCWRFMRNKKHSKKRMIIIFQNPNANLKTTSRRLGADKSKLKATIKAVCCSKLLQIGEDIKQINERIKKYLYNWILNIPQVV